MDGKSTHDDRPPGAQGDVHRSLVLLGLKHSGKSTVGALLARNLQWTGIDTDRMIADATGCGDAREVYRTMGEAAFRSVERTVCERIAARMLEEPLVVATGGGIIDNDGALQRLEDAAVFVYLRAPERILYERFMRGGRPAFLPDEAPERAWADIYRRRDRRCRDRATWTVDCGQRSPEEIAGLIRSMQRLEDPGPERGEREHAAETDSL